MLFELIGDLLPPGVVNIVNGFGVEAGKPLASSNRIAKIAFTGSTEVGKIIMRALAGTEKKMTLELGGKSANIVFDDAPIDQAVEGIVNGIFFNQGHVCCAGSRLLVHEPVAGFDSTFRVSDQVCVTTSRDVLAAMAEGGGPQRALVALGYAGWGAGQLENEIRENSWLSVPAPCSSTRKR